MNPLIRVIVATACSIALVASAAELVGKVIHVSDGDTITVLDGQHQSHKIRLSGIDAPESRQEWGRRAGQNLSHLIHGREVLVQWNSLDRYGRKLGFVFRDGRDINLEQVEKGYAWVYRNYDRTIPRSRVHLYYSAEKAARERHLGLWHDANPIAPWQWRANRRKAAFEKRLSH